MNELAQRFVKDMVHSTQTVVSPALMDGQAHIRFTINNRALLWSFTDRYIFRDSEPMDYSDYFTFDVARFLVDEWQESEDWV